MKLTKKGSQIEGSGFNKEHKFSIGDASVIIDILRNRLYSHPLQTAIQEYLCNARDANRESQASKSIEITIPTKLDPVFKVRDFGIGLTPQRIEEVFIRYGVSSKRTDNKQTGGFGIGAKSAWAYTDSFTVVSVVAGKKYTYLAHLGSNSEGSLDLIDEENSTEETGVEVSFGIKEKDILEATAAIFRTTNYWTPKPTIKGMHSVEIPREYTEPQTFKGKGFFLSKNLSPWFQFQSQKSTHRDLMSLLSEKSNKKSSFWALVDGIPYTIDNVLEENVKNSFHETNAFLEFNTGELEINANREELVFKPEVKALMVSKIKDSIEQLKSHINSRFKTATNLLEVKRLAKGLRSEFTALSGQCRFEIALTLKEKEVKVRHDGSGSYSMTLPAGDSYASAPYTDQHNWISLTEGFRSLLTRPAFDSEKSLVRNFYMQSERQNSLQGSWVIFTNAPAFYEELKSANQEAFDKALKTFKDNQERQNRRQNQRPNDLLALLNGLRDRMEEDDNKALKAVEQARKIKEKKDQEKIKKFGFQLQYPLAQTILEKEPNAKEFVYLVKEELNRQGRNYQGLEKEVMYGCMILKKKVIITDEAREKNVKDLKIPSLHDLFKARKMDKEQLEVMEHSVQWTYLERNFRLWGKDPHAIKPLFDICIKHMEPEIKAIANFFFNLKTGISSMPPEILEKVFEKEVLALKKQKKEDFEKLEAWINEYGFLKIIDPRSPNLARELPKLFKAFKKDE